MKKKLFIITSILIAIFVNYGIFAQENLSQVTPDNDSANLYEPEPSTQGNSASQNTINQYPLTLPQQNRQAQQSISGQVPAQNTVQAPAGDSNIYPEAAVQNTSRPTPRKRVINYVSPDDFNPSTNNVGYQAQPQSQQIAQPQIQQQPVTDVQSQKIQQTMPLPQQNTSQVQGTATQVQQIPLSQPDQNSRKNIQELAQVQAEEQDKEKKKKKGVLGGLFNIFRPVEEEKQPETIIIQKPEPQAPVLPEQPQPTQPMAPELPPQQFQTQPIEPAPETIPEPSEPTPNYSQPAQPVDESRIEVPEPPKPTLPETVAPKPSPENPPPLPPPPVNEKVKMPQYQPKDYSKLFSMKGLSHILLKSHFKIYYGFVSNSNQIIQRLDKLISKGNSNSFEFYELKRRFSYEFNGMKLHEMYFENLGGKTQLHPNTLLYAKMLENFGSYKAWRKEFIATSRAKGISWVILYYDPQQDCLINVGVESNDTGSLAGCAPIVVLDITEHAYIADYELSKSSYIEMFFKNLDWDIAAMRFKDAKKE